MCGFIEGSRGQLFGLLERGPAVQWNIMVWTESQTGLRAGEERTAFILSPLCLGGIVKG